MENRARSASGGRPVEEPCQRKSSRDRSRSDPTVLRAGGRSANPAADDGPGRHRRHAGGPACTATPARRTTTRGCASTDGALATTPWTFVDVFAGLGVVLLMSMLIAAPIQFANVQGGSACCWCPRCRCGSGCSARPTGPAAGMAAATWFAIWRCGSGRSTWPSGWVPAWALRFVIGIWTIAYSAITGQQPSGNLDAVLGDGLGTGVWLVVNMAVIAVIGPAIEEIFFRGLGLRSALASAWRRAGMPRFADPQRRVRYCDRRDVADLRAAAPVGGERPDLRGCAAARACSWRAGCWAG